MNTNLSKIEYKKDFINIMQDLNILVPGVIIYKQDGELFVLRKNSNEVYYRFMAPLSYFDFKGDYFAIRDFSEFNSFLKTTKDPEIFDADSHVLVKDANAQFQYPLTDEDWFLLDLKALQRQDGSWMNITFTQKPAFECKIDKFIVKEIKTVSSKITNTCITLSVKDNIMTLDCDMGREYPSWQKNYKSLIDTDAECEFKIYTDIFNFLPSGTFVLQVDEEGSIKLTLEHDEVRLDIIAAEVS